MSYQMKIKNSVFLSLFQYKSPFFVHKSPFSAIGVAQFPTFGIVKNVGRCRRDWENGRWDCIRRAT